MKAVITLSPRDCDAVLFDLDGVLTRTAGARAGSAVSSGSIAAGAIPAAPRGQMRGSDYLR